MLGGLSSCSPSGCLARFRSLRPVRDRSRKFWAGFEYRHDQANRRALSVRNVGGRGLAPTSETQNTIMTALYYSFF